MEGFKDVIVSQPPAMYSKAAYTTSISLENYKGILLCDRPVGLVSSINGGGGGSAGDGSGQGKAFVPANPTGNPVGLGPSLEASAGRKEHEARRIENARRNRTQSHQVLSRHRRWLRTFAKQVREMQSGEREQQVEAAQRAVRLRDAESRRRQEEQQQLQQQQEERPPYDPAAALEPFPKDATATAAASASAKKKPAAAASRKPKWAMTEDEALDDELGMNDDLLAFAAGLDYDRFVGDYEVAEALAVMRDRVNEIARANDWTDDDIRRAARQGVTDDDDDNDDLASAVAPSDMAGFLSRQATPAAEVHTAAVAGGAARHVRDWDAGRGRVLKRAISADALALAEKLLAASPSMQKVHTPQSLARILQRCALQGTTAVSEAALLAMQPQQQRQRGGGPTLDSRLGADLAAASAIGPQGAVGEPRVAQVHHGAVPADGDGYDQPRVLCELHKSKERTQGLPYLYRCPAI